ncbi:hypothetical protein TAMA11512_02860 [Selenomonas sp. TAMA-11512]|uniref:glycosyltransferase family 2 protein n=1 Tax=Selenomonas sp. TAMA-11512 TaxID=3095337 RepID=UPI003086EBC4|nr:hypothetical protein TAMA11512_02860 [Selenomonas sp. TAMA-11512]
MYRVVVLMSVYNGSRYLREQIDSVLSQTVSDILIYIHDDGSVDGSLEILREYASRYDNIKIHSDVHLGYPQCFFYLLKEAPEASYYAFSDQDDVWLPEKLERALEKLRNREAPALYGCPQQLADEDLQPGRINQSKARYSLGDALFTGNYIAGCTMVMNAAMRDLFLRNPVPQVAYHDEYMYILATLFGDVIYDGHPYILYRQHSANTIGAGSGGITRYIHRLRHMPEIRGRRNQNRLQYVHTILGNYDELLPEREQNLLQDVLRMSESYHSRWRLFRRLKFDCSDITETCYKKLALLFFW